MKPLILLFIPLLLVSCNKERCYQCVTEYRKEVINNTTGNSDIDKRSIELERCNMTRKEIKQLENDLTESSTREQGNNTFKEEQITTCK